MLDWMLSLLISHSHFLNLHILISLKLVKVACLGRRHWGISMIGFTNSWKIIWGIHRLVLICWESCNLYSILSFFANCTWFKSGKEIIMYFNTQANFLTKFGVRLKGCYFKGYKIYKRQNGLFVIISTIVSLSSYSLKISLSSLRIRLIILKFIKKWEEMRSFIGQKMPSIAKT
jgi:hypothetical protein